MNLRQAAGPSIGYEFATGSPTRLASELGLMFVDEDYIDVPDNSFFGPAWFVDYEREVWEGKMTFYHRHYGILSAEDTGKQLWHSWTGLRVPLAGGFATSLEFELDYDSEPAIRADSTDTTVRLKLGYQW